MVGGGGGGFGLVMRERLEEGRGGMGRTGGRWECGSNDVLGEGVVTGMWESGESKVGE